ncbi:MAG: DUF5693 family protein [Bacillota bacterium]
MVAAFYSAWQRLAIERSHKETQILLDWTQVVDSAQRENSSLEKVLADLAGKSVGGVLIKEPLLLDLENEGKVTHFNGSEFLAVADEYNIADSRVNTDHNYLIFSDQNERDRVAKHIKAKVPQAYCQLMAGGDDAFILQTSVPDNDFLSLGLGFSQRYLQIIKEAGLNMAVQIRFWGNCTPAGIDAVMSDLTGSPIVAVGFNDPYVPGYEKREAEWKEIKEYWIQSLNKLDTDIMTLEFFAQEGLSNLALAMDNHVLRCHALSEQESANLNEEETIDRLTLAASERNMKLLLLRVPHKAQVNEQQELIDDLAATLWQKGVVLKTPSPTVALAPSPFLLLLCSLGVIAGGWLLLGKLRFPRAWKYILCILVLLAMIGLLGLGKFDLLQKTFALLSVLIFPSLSIMAFLPRKRQKLPKAILLFLLMTVVSLLGAVFMAGLLADGDFMLMLRQFSGVKVAHLLPLIIVAVWAVLLADKKQSVMLGCRKVLVHPVDVGMVVIGVILLAAIAFYLMRTGNDNPNAVSDWERSFRAAMDHLMVVRPRTKEFLLGHPLLLLLCYLGYRNNKFLPILLLGAIGQVSLVNTFAHIHTPLLVSALRTVNGLILGIVLGLILIAIVFIALKYLAKRSQKQKEVK